MFASRRVRFSALILAAVLIAALAAPSVAFAAVGGPYSESVSNPEDNGIIAPTGGSLDLHGVGRLELPDGAVSVPTPIHATVWNVKGGPRTMDGAEMRTLVEFGPDGTVFANPGTLSLTIPAGINPDTAAIYAWNSGTSTWARADGTRNGDKVISSIEHFSWYGVGGQPLATSSVPASSSWSLALLAAAGVGTLLVIGRRQRLSAV
jgi:hypothetical protein